MNKTQLTAVIAAATSQDTKQTAKMVDAFIDAIQTELANGGEVALIGFGTFKPVAKPAKSGFSALAGRVVDTPARTVPKFTPGSTFKATVNSGVSSVKAA